LSDSYTMYANTFSSDRHQHQAPKVALPCKIPTYPTATEIQWLKQSHSSTKQEE
jgi:hypothetical protein